MKPKTITEWVESGRRIVGGISATKYAQIHHWLKQNYGKACKCEGENCKGISRKYEWAKKRECKYDFKRENFLQLCKSCHGSLDCTEETRQKLRKALTGRKQDPEFVRRRTIGLRGIPISENTRRAIRLANSRPVTQFKDGRKIAEYPSLTVAAKAIGKTHGAIWRNIAGLTRSKEGYEWRYAD